MRNRNHRLKFPTRRQWFLLVFTALVSLSLFFPLPFYITSPGSAVTLEPIIEVEDGYRTEKGNFMLTTIRLGPGNLGSYLYAAVMPYVEVVPKTRIHSPHETDEQYSRRQLEVMSSSQETAMLVAFRKAGYNVHVENRGAQVMMVVPGMPGAEKLQIGDVIIAVDGHEIKTSEDLLDYTSDKKVGDDMTLTFIRDGQKMSEQIRLAHLKEMNEEGDMVPTDPPRAGIGIYPVTDRIVNLPRDVEIDTRQIGGPSAGMMFTLEILNQLTRDDLTRGYQIAGTGTIQEDGSVGPIGGIEHKIVAAHREGAEIFLAPDVSHFGEKSNYELAVETAEDIKTDMKIVPVKTIDDAIHYLKRLEEK
ncbi:MAG: PDZ domain-containing protein [Bacillaceae bacterium]|nr:PDZ domain-containing protein [Bacillaceae bacterium]